jgi:hypothetical protein
MNIYTLFLSTLVHYNRFLANFLLAIFAAYIIVTGGEFENLSSLMRLDGFLIAMIGSFVIAFIAIAQVRYSTMWVHKRFPYYDLGHVKILWQTGLCLLCPFLTVCLLATTYYAFHGLFILDTMWPDLHGWPILMMLVIFNFILAIPKTQTLIPIIKSPEILLLPALHLIVYVVHRNGVNIVFFSDCTHIIDARSLKAIFKSLPPGEYIHSLRYGIFRRDNIKAAYHNKDGTATVELLTPAGETTKVSNRQKSVLNGYFTDSDGIL